MDKKFHVMAPLLTSITFLLWKRRWVWSESPDSEPLFSGNFHRAGFEWVCILSLLLPGHHGALARTQ